MIRQIFLIGFVAFHFGAIIAQEQEQEHKVPFTVEFSVSGGFYDEPVVLQLASLSGADIYFTTNGNDPKWSSAKKYIAPISIHETTVVRVIAKRGKNYSPFYSETYFINEPATNLPVLSLTIPPSYLFDPTDGLFMKGEDAVDSLWGKPGANFWSRRELPAHIQLFEKDGKTVFNSRIGFRLFGGMSRLWPQKSFAVVMRSRYGEKHLKYRLFGKAGKKKFRYLVFRNSGSDFGKSHFRDALMTSLLDHWDIEKQDYRHSHVYINGHYWGIYNIREKINRYFIQSHSEFDKDSIDLLEHRYYLKEGSRRHYISLLKFLMDNDLSQENNYQYVHAKMEVDNFMNFQIAQIYFDNKDAGGNIKYWRPQTPQGRWRWILYDTDWGFGLHDARAYTSNSLAFHTEPNGPRWPNPPWSTFILRKLLENKQFEHAFINRFCDHLNTSFHPDTVRHKIDGFYNALKPEIPRHHHRWRLNPAKWENQVGILRRFGQLRPEYMRKFIREKFETGAPVQLRLSASIGGKVILNNYLEIETEVLKGQYFKNIPIVLQAKPHYGYRFSHWEGIDLDSDSRQFLFYFHKNAYRIRAVFEKYDHPLEGKLVINEISCNNKMTGDWVELFNRSEATINLKSWILIDKKHEFRLPEILLPPKDYLLICEDSAKLTQIFKKEAYNVLSGLPFGLNKRAEMLGLYSPKGAYIDSVAYELPPADSVFTLNLLLPWLDNSNLDNWEKRNGFGTPASANPYYAESRLRHRQEAWMQIGGAVAVIIICCMLLLLRGRRLI